jgi:hypothetical protein
MDGNKREAERLAIKLRKDLSNEVNITVGELQEQFNNFLRYNVSHEDARESILKQVAKEQGMRVSEALSSKGTRNKTAQIDDIVGRESGTSPNEGEKSDKNEQTTEEEEKDIEVELSREQYVTILRAKVSGLLEDKLEKDYIILMNCSNVNRKVIDQIESSDDIKDYAHPFDITTEEMNTIKQAEGRHYKIITKTKRFYMIWRTRFTISINM